MFDYSGQEEGSSPERKSTTKNEPVSERRLAAWSAQAKEKALSLLAHLLQGLPDSLETSRAELSDLVDRYAAAAAELNRQKLHLLLFNTQKRLELSVVDELLLLKLPVTSGNLAERADSLEAAYSAAFTAEVGDLVEAANLTGYLEGLRRSIRLNVDSTVLRNNQALENFFENVTASLLEDAFSEVNPQSSSNNHHQLHPPPLKEAFEAALESSGERTLAAFARKVATFAQERPLLEGKLAQLRLALLEKAAALRSANSDAVSAYLTAEGAKIAADFERHTVSRTRARLPMDLEELGGLLEAELRKYSSLFAEDYAAKYGSYGNVYEKAVAEYSRALQAICARRQEENFRAFKEEVETPLQMAKKSILLSGAKYGTLFSFKRFVSCLHESKSHQKKLDLITNL